CVAVSRRTHNCFGADIAAATRLVLNNEWLPESRRQPLANHARKDIGGTAGRNRDHDTHWPRWICLCPNAARGGWERYGTCCQPQKFPARKFHSPYPQCG